MQAFVGNLIQHKARRALSPEFKHALAREVLKTERLRVIALIITATVVAAGLTTADAVAPAILDRIWRGHFPVLYLLAGYVGFVVFEASVLALVSRQLKRDLDVPRVRRYVGAFIETSLPSLVLVVHMNNMGAVQALGFVGPLLYFVFIILSTLRLDFWLSTFTGFVAAAELLGLALFHPATQATGGEPMLAAAFLTSRSAVIFACGVLAGAVGVQLRRQFEASIVAATARDYVTNLFGQHVSPQVVDRLLAAGSTTSSDTRQVAVMFVDIRGFTAAARTRTPQEVVDRLDAAFTVLVEIVDRNGGIVNKFLGGRLPGAVWCAARRSRRAAARRHGRARNACRDRAAQYPQRLAAAHWHRTASWARGGGQRRLAAAQGIHRDRRHSEFGLQNRGPQQGIRVATPDIRRGLAGDRP